VKLEGKVAIVTGGARGNGLASALALAGEGADIAIADICADIDTVPYPLSTQATLDDAVKQVEALGRKAIGIVCDVRDEGQVEAMVARVVEEFGHVDILINNAGVTSLTAVVDMPEEEWDNLVDTHLKSAFLCSKHAVPHMIEQHWGKVVSIGSAGSFKGFGLGAHYSAAKHGLLGFTKSLAMEVADHNINVNAVCPGTVWTDMMIGLVDSLGMDQDEAQEQFTMDHLMNADQPITSEDVAKAVLWLCTDDSRNTTGFALAVDSGWLAH
jgi:NAD(P)-dependent dehydrogenase (short-subunit alcohol dehydrogenase family)